MPDIHRITHGGQVGSYGSAMAMVNAGLRVASGIPTAVASAPIGYYSVPAMSSQGDDDISVKGSLLQINLNSVRRATDGSLWVLVLEGLIDWNAKGDPGLERSQIDLGKFLGFLSLETDSAMDGSKSTDTQRRPGINGNKESGANGRNCNGRKKRR
ncbi:hypothetical protein NE237_019132 [Protea cynaroides]|uniref:Uncharacterized protein n=1 Tax=Protea cynaroides TaxID=273540 RepID=A0A9Q0KB55_9MAGN|nr:hypothetical protein NE237_019132 [Protea cynaroides]